MPLFFGFGSDGDEKFMVEFDSVESSECLRFLPFTGGVVLRIVSSLTTVIERFVPLFFEFELSMYKIKIIICSIKKISC